MKLKRRKKSSKQLAEEVKKVTTSPIEKSKKVEVRKVISTGSTLLDLAISGNRIRGGGVPGGIIMEVFGPPGSGKTAILAELCASAQFKKGDVKFLDPEGRLDQEYCRIYGMNIPKVNYKRPDTVTEMFGIIQKWKPKADKSINVIAADSLAALSTELELGEKGDKMGMRRGKEFSEGLRKTCRLIANNNWLIACSNQLRESQYGEITPGGRGIPFYSSLRIRIQETDKIRVSKKIVEKEEERKEVKVGKVIGIESHCIIKKSTVDDPYRETPIYIIFGYGIDDIRGNLQYLKDMTGETTYDCVNKNYSRISDAIRYIEDNDLQDELKEKVIDLWEEIEDKFLISRKSKNRG
jgi:RecA/RadA recombinase